ncbi:MAG: RNA-binding protein [Desulfurellaceae bacterium]|nr:RNA-binding protein [Desulfurellaceae bacterium]
MATNLYIGNLSFETTTPDLETLFGQAGTVTSANIIMDRDTGRSRGFGFVEMGSASEAQAAIKQFDGYEFQGRALKVNEAKPREPRSGGHRSSGGGHERRW